MIQYPMADNSLDALKVIALLRFVGSKSVNLFFSGAPKRSKCINKLVKLGLIERVNKKIKNQKGEVKSYTLYQIKGKGIKYLAQNDCGIFVAAYDQENMTVFSRKESYPEEKLKLAHINTAMILTYIAGADIPAGNFGAIGGSTDDTITLEDYPSDDKEGEKSAGYTLNDFYKDCILSEEDLEDVCFDRKPLNQDDPKKMIFRNRRLIKRTLTSVSANKNVQEFSSGRYAGILDSHKKCLMIYVAPCFTFSWTMWLIRAEDSAYRMWARTKALASLKQQETAGKTAAFIVSNAQEFKYHYNGIENRPETKEVFGGMFTHVYIVPNDLNGAKLLRGIALINDEELIEKMSDFAVNSGEYKRLTKKTATPFCLVNSQGHYTAICMLMDAKSFHRIASFANDHPNQQVQVICLDWQQNYISRVLPENVYYRVFPSSLINL